MLSNKAGDLVPTRVPAGTASMPLKAWRLADNACMARDAQLSKASCTGEHSQEDLVHLFAGDSSITSICRPDANGTIVLGNRSFYGRYENASIQKQS